MEFKRTQYFEATKYGQLERFKYLQAKGVYFTVFTRYLDACDSAYDNKHLKILKIAIDKAYNMYIINFDYKCYQIYRQKRVNFENAFIKPPIPPVKLNYNIYDILIPYIDADLINIIRKDYL